MNILDGMKVLNLSLNLPGPAAARRLHEMGASVVKVESPAGDPMELYNAKWYRDMAVGHSMVRLDLKVPDDKARLDLLLLETGSAHYRHPPGGHGATWAGLERAA